MHYQSSYAPAVLPYGGIGSSLAPSGQAATTTPAIPPLTDATPEQTASKLRVAITVSGVAALLGFGIGIWAKMR